MKYLAAVLALLGWSQAKAEQVVVFQQSELELYRSEGLIKVESSEGNAISINQDLMDALRSSGRVRELKIEDSANCGVGNSDVMDSTKR